MYVRALLFSGASRSLFVAASTLLVVAIAISHAHAQQELTGQASSSKASKMVAQVNPKVLDIARFYDSNNPSFRRFFDYFTGKQQIDGLPFQLDGQVTLYGKSMAARGHKNLKSIREIKVGRKIDYLHLIHHTFWPDVHSETVASVSMNYADGTSYVIPIRYGHQVRDWTNMPAFDKETLSDSNTTICWRGRPLHMKAPRRLFKSSLANPLPDRVVETIEFSSAENLASYSLLAATVSSSAPINRAEDRNFDAAVDLKVVDAETGKPIAKALVEVKMALLGEFVVGDPIYTDDEGKGTIPYPTKHTKRIEAFASKEGYMPASSIWRTPLLTNKEIRLVPSHSQSSAESIGPVKVRSVERIDIARTGGRNEDVDTVIELIAELEKKQQQEPKLNQNDSEMKVLDQRKRELLEPIREFQNSARGSTNRNTN